MELDLHVISFLFSVHFMAAPLSDARLGEKLVTVPSLPPLFPGSIKRLYPFPDTRREARLWGQGEIWGLHPHFLCPRLPTSPAHSPSWPVEAVREENRSSEGKTHSTLLVTYYIQQNLKQSRAFWKGRCLKIILLRCQGAAFYYQIIHVVDIHEPHLTSELYLW